MRFPGTAFGIIVSLLYHTTALWMGIPLTRKPYKTHSIKNHTTSANHAKWNEILGMKTTHTPIEPVSMVTETHVISTSLASPNLHLPTHLPNHTHTHSLTHARTRVDNLEECNTEAYARCAITHAGAYQNPAHTPTSYGVHCVSTHSTMATATQFITVQESKNLDQQVSHLLVHMGGSYM